MPMQPLPVHMSRTHSSRPGFTQGAKPSPINSAIGERGTSTASLTSNSRPANQAVPSR